MVWEVLESNYIANLLEKAYTENDNKLEYIKEKIKRRGIEYITLSEYNYIRNKKNYLVKINSNENEN